MSKPLLAPPLRTPKGSGESDVNHELCFSPALQDTEWDEFVLGQSEPYLEQLSGWAEVKHKHGGWGVTRFAIKRLGKMVGGAQILELKVARHFKVGYLCRGPLAGDDQTLREVLQALKFVARQNGYLYLALSLPYSCNGMVAGLEAEGFFRRPPQMPPAVWVRATLVLDLTKESEALFAEMRATTRNLVRRSARAGVVVRDGTESDLPRFCELVEALCQRRGVSSNMPPESGLRMLWRLFHAGESMKLFIAEHEGRMLCGLIVFGFGKWARAWRIGWSGKDEKLFPTQATYWAAIQWCKARGFQHFDVLGVDERDAREILLGRASDAPFHCSITKFKSGLGGRYMMLPGEWCYFPNPILRTGFQWFGARLMTLSMVGKLANDLRNRSTADSRTIP